MNETIAAICTPFGEGAISVIRLSGPNAFAIAGEMFSGPVLSYASHTAHLGKILSKNGTVIDEVLLLKMDEGKSFTGEATVEFMCHGGILVTQKVLGRALEAGARAAHPGEFSQRAFQNGRIDLAQAEAIQELIAAKNERALKEASKQLSGRLSIVIKELQQRLTDIAAIMEAACDYPEEGLEFATPEEVIEMLEETLSKMCALSSTFSDGGKFSQGVTLCLIGPPNAGKSSLMNLLLNKNRAIVTDIAGTTRDLLEEDFLLDQYSFRLIDTAGIRQTEEVIEKEGIHRSKEAAKEADLVLALFDCTKPFGKEEEELLEQYPHHILIWNKCDLPHSPPPRPGILFSVKENLGVQELKQTLLHRIFSSPMAEKEAILLTKERHYRAVVEAEDFVKKAIEGLKMGSSPEFAAYDLRSALFSLASIIGTNITEDILGAIFSKFCVGK